MLLKASGSDENSVSPFGSQQQHQLVAGSSNMTISEQSAQETTARQLFGDTTAATTNLSNIASSTGVVSTSAAASLDEKSALEHLFASALPKTEPQADNNSVTFKDSSVISEEETKQDSACADKQLGDQSETDSVEEPPATSFDLK